MKPIWKGAVSFGLVSVPVALYPAEVPGELHFHLVDARDHARIRNRRVNELSGKEVTWEHIVKAHELPDGRLVELTDEDFRAAAPEAGGQIEILAFVSAAEVDPVYYDKPYYLEPDAGAAKGYALLREALKRSGRVGVARVIIRTRQRLALLRPMGQVLSLELIHWAHDLRNTTGLNLPGDNLDELRINPRELAMAETLIASMSEAWVPEQYHDEYHDKLLAWITEKAEGAVAPPAPPGEEAGPDKVVDMMALLKKSVERAKHPRKAVSG